VFEHIWVSNLVFTMLATHARMLTPQHPGSILVQLQACLWSLWDRCGLAFQSLLQESTQDPQDSQDSKEC